MLTKKQLRILEIFRKNLGKGLTFNQLKEKSKTKSNDFLQRTLGNCIREGIISTKSLGNNIIYNLNLLNPATLAYFSLINMEFYSLPYATLSAIEEELTKETPFFSLVVFGSYAKKQETKSSDLDLAVIIENNKKLSQIEARIESLKLKSKIKLDIHIITFSEFIEMLNNDEENLGKQIAREHIVYSSPGIFYNSIEKWIQQ